MQPRECYRQPISAWISDTWLQLTPSQRSLDVSPPDNQTKSREMCTRLLTRDFGGPHLRGPTLAMQLARQHRERALAGTVTPIRIREEPLFILGYCAMYRACPPRARWGQSDRSVAHHI